MRGACLEQVVEDLCGSGDGGSLVVDLNTTGYEIPPSKVYGNGDGRGDTPEAHNGDGYTLTGRPHGDGDGDGQ